MRNQKIDFNSEYPCPCRRKGRLLPIALTEAFGCERCQQIFVVDENGQVIEQLASNYPYKRTWRWTGKDWTSAQSPWSSSYLPVALGIILVLLIVWLPLALRAAPGISMVIWTVIALLLAILPAFMVWLAYRR